MRAFPIVSTQTDGNLKTVSQAYGSKVDGTSFIREKCAEFDCKSTELSFIGVDGDVFVHE